MGLDDAIPKHRRPWNARRFFRNLVLAAVVMTIPVVLAMFPGAISRRSEEVDLRSGRIRHTRYACFFMVRQTTVESPFSKVRPPNPADTSAADWRLVNSFVLGGRVSPHHSFHGAIAQMRRCEILWAVVPFTDEVKGEMVKTILRLWQSAGDYGWAEEYIRGIEQRVAGLEGRAGQKLTLVDLPWMTSATGPTSREVRNSVTPSE